MKDDYPEATDLFEKITSHEKVAYAAINTFDAGYRKGQRDLHEVLRARNDFERSARPFMVLAIGLFGSGIVGAVLYGLAARMGWMNIIGVCLQ